MNGLVVVAILLVTAQVVTQPKLLEAADPAYPDAARAYEIDGMAGFRATVSPEGTVTSVILLSVPRSNLGFEDAVEQAVRKWRFAPATLDGTPNMEPARVAIGAIVEAAALVSTDSPARRLGTTLFSPAIINEWFLSQLSAELGATPEAMHSEPDARAAQSRRLMPPGVSDACSTNSVTASRDNLQALTPPRRIYEFQPPYPGRAALDQKEAVAVVEADLTEHGTIVRPSPREGSGDFQIAAQQAVLLWRFEAARSGGCPVPVRFTVTVQFRMP